MQQQLPATAAAISGISTDVSGQAAGVASAFNEDYIVPHLHNPHNNCFIHTVLQLLLNCHEITDAFFKPENQAYINRNPSLVAYRDFARRVSSSKDDKEADFSVDSLEPLIAVIRNQFHLGDPSKQGDLNQLFQSFCSVIFGLDEEAGMLAKDIIQSVLIDERGFLHLDVVAPIERDQAYIAGKQIDRASMDEYIRACLIGAQTLPESYLAIQVDRTTGQSRGGRAVRNGFILTDIEQFYDMGIVPSPSPDVDFNGHMYELVGVGVHMDRVQHCVAYVKKNGKWLLCSDSHQSHVTWEMAKQVFARDAQLFIFKKIFVDTFEPAAEVEFPALEDISTDLFMSEHVPAITLPAPAAPAVPARVAAHKLFKTHDYSIAAALLAGSAYVGWRIYNSSMTHKKLVGVLVGAGVLAVVLGKLCWNKAH
jgi:hypothetical protein